VEATLPQQPTEAPAALRDPWRHGFPFAVSWTEALYSKVAHTKGPLCATINLNINEELSASVQPQSEKT